MVLLPLSPYLVGAPSVIPIFSAVAEIIERKDKPVA